ncbi:MAG: HEAT repeat domain-containing protein [Gemmatimonadaceae bacterium]|nr:HEAT repeat domain-containing protein [Gemmatimonadaceae bacterium]NUQ92042.1 HEAT repeat domain-containing protein [Gemmatimonadaceae bacterium]NUR19454.1 HEAT repeat domain-containing protein [Gemmatimonadaceae bacterium]NUS97957.1 HEAT repeat domain-containing protein [Gemmatimonadaceae bacterium]
MTTQAVPNPTTGAEREEPPFAPTIVEELMKLFVKAVRAHQLYLHNNPIYLRAIELLGEGFAAVWAQAEEIALAFTEAEIRWSDRTVLSEPAKSADSLPWLFFKDGIREVRILRGFESEELPKLLDVIQRARKATPDDDDLLTMLWEQDFLLLRYRFVDLALESAPPLLDSVPAEMRQQPEASPAQLQESVAVETRAGVVSLEDFDSTLYFLDDREIDYLRGEVKSEYERDLRPVVLGTLLDVFEAQWDATVRNEICDILDGFILHLLSAGQFRAVAYLLREVTATLGRAKEVKPEQRQKLESLPARLSAPEALSQLLQSLEEASDLPPQADLSELFEQLRPTALSTVFAWLARLQHAQLKPLLEAAAARLAGQNTAELVKLIAAPNEVVAGEAIRRAGALKTAAAVAPLAAVMNDGAVALRLLAVQALNEIASPGALQVLEKSVDDPERDVRVATLRAIAARVYRPALPRIDAAVKGKRAREVDLTEKMALFEAFGALAGDPGVNVLDELLNGKGFLGRREDPELRACAAMALGRIGTQAATASLRKASSENEKEVLVRNAINRAIRGGQP